MSANSLQYTKYRRAVLNHNVARLLAKLVTVRVPFEYKPGYSAGWSHISVPHKHSATLDRCLDHLRLGQALADLEADSL